MIHSASLRATGSEIDASTCVASADLRERTSSSTFCTASMSACEVEEVAAMAGAGGGFLAGGGTTACWRVAGWITGAGLAASSVTGGLDGLLATAVLGTTLRAIGRAFGNGTFGLGTTAPASDANADNPSASTRL